MEICNALRIVQTCVSTKLVHRYTSIIVEIYCDKRLIFELCVLCIELINVIFLWYNANEGTQYSKKTFNQTDRLNQICIVQSVR